MAGDNDKKGFGGFDDLLSDVTNEVNTPVIKPLDPVATPTHSSTTLHQTQEPSPVPIPQSSPEKGNGAVVGWFIFGIFVVIILVARSGVVQDASTSTPNYQQTYTPPNEQTTATQSSNIAPATESDPEHVNIIEELPPAGNGLVLNNNQIRYCFAENIRLNTIKNALDRYSQFEVDKYNAEVGDLNSRCTSFRYMGGAVENVQTGEKSRHAAHVVEAMQRLDSWRGPTPARETVSNEAQFGQNILSPESQIQTSQEAKQRKTSLRDLSQEERSSIESACSSDKFLNGPAAYNTCLNNQLAAMENAPSHPNLNKLLSSEKSSIESACSSDKFLNGPAAYNTCLNNQLAAMENAPRQPSLTALSSEERNLIETACYNDKFLNGPAAYNTCLARQLASVR